MRRWVAGIAVVLLLPACGGGGSTGGGGGGGGPGLTGLPAHFAFGLGNGPADLGWMTGSGVPWGYRYQYLSGGVNTGGGWSTWNSPSGQFATYYLDASEAAGIVPVFTYYQMVGSTPDAGSEDPTSKFASAATMDAYYADFKLLMQKCGAFGGPVIVHVEPDLWGFCHGISSNPSSIAVRVASSGHADVAGLPNTLSGFAQALVRLRDDNGPNVILAWHASHWAAGADLILNAADPEDHADATLSFYTALNADFDLFFHDPSDRDAGFKQHVYGDGGASWWDAADFERYRAYLARMHAQSGLRGVLWQVPCGNTLYRTCNDTWGHYQDNRAEFFLEAGNLANVQAYAAAGVIAVLFGSTDGGTTSYLDAQGDDVTNPAAINGNTLVATEEDDDGGFLRSAAGAYYGSGPATIP